jgi:arylsulfatase A-like enzyme
VASAYKNPPCSIIRKGDWKLIQFLLDGRVELYNIREDLKECYDLSKNKPEMREKLLKELSNWRRINNMPLPPASILPF